jgi:hypothetical protein
MARVKPLDLAVVQEWLAARESGPFTDDAVRHLQSLIIDPLCLVVVSRTAQPGISTYEADGTCIRLVPPLPALKPTVYAVQGDDGRWQMHRERQVRGLSPASEKASIGSPPPPSFSLKYLLVRSRRSIHLSVNCGTRPA